MPQLELLSPGVYGFEKTPNRAPEGISPAKAALVGWTDEGPSNTPIEVRSASQAERIFGPISTLGLVPISWQAFFGNGGERCIIVRTVAADAVAALVEIDSAPGPTKWTFVQRGEGIWGNVTQIRVNGNRNFLDRTVGSEKWDKFDVLVLRPSEFDPTILISEERYEAVQFTDPDGGDYIANVLGDPRRPSLLVTLTEGAGGTPSGLLATQQADVIMVPGASVTGQTNFVVALGEAVLDNTLRIVAADAIVDDEVQAPAVPPDDTLTAFGFTLSIFPVLDGSLRLFYSQLGDLADNLGSGPFATGTVNGGDTVFQIAAGALSQPVHRETTVFRIRFAKVAGASPELLHTDGGGGAAHDISTTPMTSIPVHPGTVAITLDIGAGPVVVLDDGAGNLQDPGGVWSGPATIDYATGAMTGVTNPLLAASTVVAVYDISGTITKGASADNLDQAVALAGDVGGGTNTIALVDSVTTPIQSGVIDFVADVAPLTGTDILVDFVPVGIVNSDVDGSLTELGGGAGAAGSADYVTGVVALTTLLAARTGSTIDADYQTGQVATDNGIGRLVGDVDASGNNTIDYDTGDVDVTWDSAPTNGQDILANYVNLAGNVTYQMAGGLNGTAVSRADVSAAALEVDKKGIYALDFVEEPLNVVVPDYEGSEFVQFDLVQFAKNRPDMRYLLMGYANGTTRDEAIQYVQVEQAWDEKIGAMYYPNIYFVNPLTDRPELIPCTPFVAGVFARTARNKNVGKAPGGVEDGAINAAGVVGPEWVLELSDRNALYQSRINPIISSQATRLAVWGVRGLSRELRWRYINTRTLHNFLMHSLSLNLQWAVFENNGPPLWVKIETALKGYMGSLFRLGYFFGEIEADAFFVVCNATNNNSNTIAGGKAVIEIGFTANTPAEFVTFTLQQPVGQTG